MDTSDIKNWPSEQGLALYKSLGKLYAVIETRVKSNSSNKWVTRRKIVGRIIDNCFYTMEEFHSKFNRNGTIRAIPENARVVRPRGRASNLAKSLLHYGLVPNKIKNMPSEPNISVMKNNGILYVVINERFAIDGKYKVKRTYLGKIIDNCFYTMQECKEMNNKARSVSFTQKAKLAKQKGA